MSKYSSFKSHQLITESFRKFLKEGLYDYADTAVEKLNNLWRQLRKQGALKIMSEADLIKLAKLTGDEVLVLSELWEIPGVFWSEDGPKKDAEGNTILDDKGRAAAFFAPDDPSARDTIETEKDARERTGGAAPGEQIGLPGFEQE
tara:strand:+ start:190 stop:627 length:438 start_codon:yes stop_codon:yes gene_type:complete